MQSKRSGLVIQLPLVFLGVLAWMVFTGPFSWGAEAKKQLPPRGISISPEFTGVILPQGESATLEVNVINLGEKDEDIDVTITTVPKGWKAWLKTYNFGVTGLHLRSDKTKTLTLRAEPGPDVVQGKYTFDVLAQTSDKKLQSSCQVVVQVKEKKEGEKSEGVKIVTSYPVLRGPTDRKYEFSLEVSNDLGKDTIFNLVASGPENWDINFKPAYEEKFISSLRLKENQSQTVAVEVKPSAQSAPGQYAVSVKVSAPEAKSEVALTVVLTGTYRLEAGTASGLLSLNALQGQKANLSFYVKNTGSAPLTNVQFLSVKPENWQLEFKPEKIETIAPEELKQVEVSITPHDQALVGDYSVGISVDAGNPSKASKNLELRVAVRASTAWGWIGIGIIIFVMAGLVVLFVRMGRR